MLHVLVTATRAVHGSGRFWTQPGPDPPCVGWEAEGPETDRRHHSVESVLGSGGVRVGVGSESSHINILLQPDFKNKK